MFLVYYVNNLHPKIRKCSEILYFRQVSLEKASCRCSHWEEMIQDDQRIVMVQRLILWLRFFCIHTAELLICYLLLKISVLGEYDAFLPYDKRCEI